MARRTINAAELFDEVQVDLWGTKFLLKTPTRTVEKEIADAFNRLQEAEVADDAPAEEIMPELIGIIETMLDPIKENGAKLITVKALIKREYKADNIGISHLMALAGGLMNRGVDRPT